VGLLHSMQFLGYLLTRFIWIRAGIEGQILCLLATQTATATHPVADAQEPALVEQAQHKP